MRHRRPLEPHELPLLVLGVLCGVVTAVAIGWFVLRVGIADEIDLGASILMGVIGGSAAGVALVGAARRARL
jgi:high-affinity Fe2+/Pb2+ permease